MNPLLKTILILLPLSVAILLTGTTGKLKAITIVLLISSWITTKLPDKNETP